MIITAKTNKKFKVSDEWMKACGLSDFHNVFDVKLIEDVAPGLVYVTLCSPIIGHGGTWVVKQERGEFIN